MPGGRLAGGRAGPGAAARADRAFRTRGREARLPGRAGRGGGRGGPAAPGRPAAAAQPRPAFSPAGRRDPSPAQSRFFPRPPGGYFPPARGSPVGRENIPGLPCSTPEFFFARAGQDVDPRGGLEAALPAALEIRRELPAPVRVRQALPPAPPAPAPRARAPRPGAHQPLAHSGLVAVGAPPDPGRRPALLPPHARVRPVALPGVRLSPRPPRHRSGHPMPAFGRNPRPVFHSRRGRAAWKAPARRRPRPYST